MKDYLNNTILFPERWMVRTRTWLWLTLATQWILSMWSRPSAMWLIS